MTFADLPIGATFMLPVGAAYLKCGNVYIKTRQDRVVNTCSECGHKTFVANAKNVETSNSYSFSGETLVERLQAPVEVTA
jgi:predicted  nucleic acid-binding Zn-ribbon protein